MRTELTQDGYVSKLRTTKTGRATGGKPFERGALYAILKNQTYLGLTTHKGETFDGEHDPIVAKAPFEKVQTILESNRRTDKQKTRAKDPSLLSGKIITETGIVLTPTHAQTHGRRYRYYVERRRGSDTNHQQRPIRLPAAEIESSVCNELAAFLSDPIRLMDGLEISKAAQEIQTAVCNKAQAAAKRITRAALQQDDKVMVRQIVKQIVLEKQASGYTLTLDLNAIGQSLELETETDMGEAIMPVVLELKVCNNGKKVIISNKPTQTAEPNPALISALRSAHEIKAQYMNTEGRSLSKIAADLNMDARHIWRTLKLAYLAPDIQLAILSGTQPKGLLLKDLIYQAVPTDWNEQRTMLGFA